MEWVSSACSLTILAICPVLVGGSYRPRHGRMWPHTGRRPDLPLGVPGRTQPPAWDDRRAFRPTQLSALLLAVLA